MPFCDQQLQQPSTKNDPCCDKQLMINDDGALMCQSCGTVNDYQSKITLIFMKIDTRL